MTIGREEGRINKGPGANLRKGELMGAQVWKGHTLSVNLYKPRCGTFVRVLPFVNISLAIKSLSFLSSMLIWDIVRLRESGGNLRKGELMGAQLWKNHTPSVSLYKPHCGVFVRILPFVKISLAIKSLSFLFSLLVTFEPKKD